ncbi:MAG: metallophosphoesterase [Acidobacteria bacterium]|nr:metallophosphoesterase [Acidobacteriota bacterium]
MNINSHSSKLLISRRELLKSIGAITLSTLIRPSSLVTATPVKREFRFIVLGDWGCGSPEQMRVAKQMFLAHQNKPIDFILTVGDNIYRTGNKKYYPDFFEKTYDNLLKEDVKFFATLGNHDVIDGRYDQINYSLFNMGGKQFYTIKRGQGLVEFFMLDATSMDNQQLAWFENSLKASDAFWKIALFHFPIYSSGKHHGSDLDLRKKLEPLLVKYNVRAAFTGHEHIYERTHLQKGVQHFVTGGGGASLYDIESKSPLTAASYVGWHFMLVEIDDKAIKFQTINDNGVIVDSGTFK